MKRRKEIFLFCCFLLGILSLKLEAAQNSYPPSPSRCQAASWYIGLPNKTQCGLNLSIGLSGITGYLGRDTRIHPDLVSANQFCKEYTKDPSAYAISASVHNYCSGCDQYLAYWTGSRWAVYQACAGELNIQAITCATQCRQCLSHQIKRCVGKSIYWFDSCGNQEDLYKNCAPNETCENGECKLLIKPPLVITKPVVNTY